MKHGQLLVSCADTSTNRHNFGNLGLNMAFLVCANRHHAFHFISKNHFLAPCQCVPSDSCWLFAIIYIQPSISLHFLKTLNCLNESAAAFASYRLCLDHHKDSVRFAERCETANSATQKGYSVMPGTTQAWGQQ